MNETVQDTLDALELGGPQTFRNVAVVPILIDADLGPEYITLGEALRQAILEVAEVSEEGTVPHIRVINKGDAAVLLVDGEELTGAKQNRVVNATVLLGAKTETKLDVSCTERGRWSYSSERFADSGVAMPSRMRAKKSRSVAASLRQSQSFASNQGEVWEEVAHFSERAGVASDTDAMRDVYTARESELRDAIKAFRLLDNQCGLIFIVDGAPIGMDLVSRRPAYRDLHEKLLTSYIIDTELKDENENEAPSMDTIEQFIDQAKTASQSCHKSVGLGDDFRYQNGNVCGSALVYEKTCIHAAFFTGTSSEETPKMRGFRQRRRSRQS